jgi:hypothetical protein
MEHALAPSGHFQTIDIVAIVLLALGLLVMLIAFIRLLPDLLAEERADNEMIRSLAQRTDRPSGEASPPPTTPAGQAPPRGTRTG